MEETVQESCRQSCRHHWIIESPKGSTSRGVCKSCGAVRYFKNSYTDSSDWAQAYRNMSKEDKKIMKKIMEEEKRLEKEFPLKERNY